MIKALERVTPESVGLRSGDILDYIDKLEALSTEVHGVMIARHGKVVAEGWWSPYAPYLHHANQSLTKTYTTTAIGILIDEGKLHLDDNVAELLKDHFPSDALPYASRLTLRDLLTMHAGVEEITFASSPTWIEDFFRAIKVEPGSKWLYSGMCTAMLGAVIRAVSGERIKQFLAPRVFDKIGIDPENIKWIEHSDGLEYCGGGIFSTTEDNLRLGLLYLGMGEFDGKRVVSEEWVREATKKQVTNPTHDGEEDTYDENSGYGYQVWISHTKPNYIFWGAHGQYILCMPESDMCVSLTQFVDGPGGDVKPENELKIFELAWELGRKAGEALPEDPETLAKLTRRMSHLALERKPSAPVPNESLKYSGTKYAIEENGLSVIPSCYGTDRRYGICVTSKLPVCISEMGFKFDKVEMSIHVVAGGREFDLAVGLDGIARVSELNVAHDLPSRVLCQAVWLDGDTCRIFVRYIETCYETVWTMRFGDDPRLTIKEFALFSPDGWITTELKAERKQ